MKTKYLVGIIVGVIVIGAAVIFGTIANSHVNAYVNKKTLHSNVTAQVNNARNAIESQGNFEQMRADVNADISRIALAKSTVKADPSTINQTNLQGLQYACISTTQNYNAAARSISSQQFRTADLPYQLNPNRCN